MTRISAAILALAPAMCAAAEPAKPLTPADRIPWNDSKVIGSPEPPTPYRTKRVFERLKLSQPIYLAAEPGTNDYLVVEHSGNGAGPGGIRRFANSPDVTDIETVLGIDYLIYGFCFHPKFKENGLIYLMANGPMSEKDHKRNRIVRYTIDRQPPHKLDPQSELVILEWESNGHNGGELGFGPDGMLYCPTGDGTSDSDTILTGQGVDDLLAVLLRIDVDHPDPGKTVLDPERQPVRRHARMRGRKSGPSGSAIRGGCTFDAKTGAHVGRPQRPGPVGEAYLVTRGGNYGWSVMEGSHPFYLERKPRGRGRFVPPTVEHPTPRRGR